MTDSHTIQNAYFSDFSDWFWIYDKKVHGWKKGDGNDKPLWRIHRNNISVIPGFYDHSDSNEDENEKRFWDQENQWKEVREKYKNIPIGYVASEEDKKLLSKIVSRFMLRTPKSFNEFEDMYQSLQEKIGPLASEEVKNQITLSESDRKKLKLEMIFNHPLPFDTEFDWCFYKSTDSMHKFILSDSPVISNTQEIPLSEWIVPLHSKFFVINPGLCLNLIHKNEITHKFDHKGQILKIDYRTIRGINEMAILHSDIEIYAYTKKQKDFIEKYMIKNKNVPICPRGKWQ
jgi:hypothetical protein